MVIFFLVSFLASIAGNICGIGGGIIIKPVLDMLGLADVSTSNFLSGCTVLSMTLYSVGRMVRRKEKSLDIGVSVPLGLGAALGGVVGKECFSFIKAAVGNADMTSFVQAVCLGVITVGTLIYTLNKKKIKTKAFKNKAVCVLIGLALGMSSSFLGIGGGPINLVVLYYFFSMDTKTAAANSLCIILMSQITSLFTTVATGAVPDFEWGWLILMAAGGVLGGIAGSRLNHKMDNAAVDKLFIGIMALIIIICIYNAGCTIYCLNLGRMDCFFR